jgi:alpha-1,2-mannosyltransferase
MMFQRADGALADAPSSTHLTLPGNQAADTTPNLAQFRSQPVESRRLARWARIERVWWVVLGITMLVFTALPISNFFLRLSIKDYGLWYQVGLAVRQGVDIYPRPETGRLFPFMYPPAAAAMLALVSFLGPLGSLLFLVFVNSASWIVCILLSVWLAVGPGRRRHPLIVIVPSLAVIVLVHNIYLLGQPNLLLLAILLGAFACLRLGNQVAAGALVATAAAIKAFPILVLGYLVYRRMWVASATTVAALAGWLLLAPLPFRGPDRVIDDLVVWSQGMVFTYNSYGIAQRPFRSYSYKNQSIMALAHRLLRDVPADGEAVLSERSRKGQTSPLAGRALRSLDPATDLLALLKPHQRGQNSPTRAALETRAAFGSGATGDQAPRWDQILQEAEPALRSAWRINLVNLNFQTVTVVTVFAILAICLFVAAVFAPQARRTPETDALEFALVTLLTTMFSPLSFNYAYVWLLYPITVALHRVLGEPRSARSHRLKVAWIAAVLLIPAFAIPFPQVAQAYGNLFVPALLLVFGLGAMLAAAGRCPLDSTDDARAHLASGKVADLHAGVASVASQGL